MSSSKPQWIHDVFLSFRGEDTRKNFVSHLYSSLSNSGINTFIDDEKLHKGEELGPDLLRAIEGSQVAIVVFSKYYAQSTWCLDELVKIMECRTTKGQVVLPVFYDVSPSYVRYQEDTVGEAFKKRSWIGINQMSDWKNALTEAANLSGWDVRNFKNEAMVVKEILDTVLEKIDSTYLSIAKFPVGLEPRVQDLIQFLKRQSKGVCMVGIWGMGGIGKTTIAKAVYNKIHREFEGKSFLATIRVVWEKDRGQIDLQEQLLCDILKTRNMKIHSIEWGKAMIKERLCRKRALVVLDDVNKSEQLNALCGNCDWVGPGSVIIVTTRDVRLLNDLKVDYVYRMQGMNKSESLELFSWHSFREASPRKDFLELSRNVVAYCGGLPLALEVLGSYLYERTKEQRKSVLSKLKAIPNDEIQEKLKISFDGLKDHTEKAIFLDICCFFIGKDRTYVTQILNGCGLYADIGIPVLIERSLIKVEKNNKLGVHGLIQDMGREVVRKSSPEEPEKRSRLWFHKDVLDVLRENTGTKAVEGLALKLQGTCFSTHAFEKMERLRLLQLDHVQLNGDYGYLSKKLRWVSWQGFPRKCIPDNFDQGNTVAIDLRRSNLKQVWKKPQGLTTNGSSDFTLPGDNHPCWLTHTGEGHSVLFKVPQVSECCMKGMALCVVYSSTPENVAAEFLISVLIVNYTKCTIQIYKRDTAISFNDEEWQGIISNLGPGDKVEIFVAFGHGLTVKTSTVYLIYGESINVKMESSLKPKKNAFTGLINRMKNVWA